MNRFVCFIFLFLLAILPLAAQDFGEIEDGFDSFATTIANSLPFNALIGQHWSDSFIGKFPHFGIGGTVGATFIPVETVVPVLNALDITLPSELTFLEEYGIPFPAYTIDARIGLPFLPMDLGVKFGTLPEEALSSLPENLSLEYMLVGADVRFQLLKENILLPEVSVGAGYNYLQGALGINGILDGDQQITDLGGYNITMTNPNLAFNWNASVIDLKAQISKNLLILKPFAGVGASYGISNAGGGLESTVQLNGHAITPEEIEAINTAVEVAGGVAPDLSDAGILVQSAITGWAVRAYGGIGLKLAVIYLDLMAAYNFTSQAYGASINLRLEL